MQSCSAESDASYARASHTSLISTRAMSKRRVLVGGEAARGAGEHQADPVAAAIAAKKGEPRLCAWYGCNFRALDLIRLVTRAPARATFPCDLQRRSSQLPRLQQSPSCWLMGLETPCFQMSCHQHRSRRQRRATVGLGRMVGACSLIHPCWCLIYAGPLLQLIPNQITCHSSTEPSDIMPYSPKKDNPLAGLLGYG